jgi:hypothetical protein
MLFHIWHIFSGIMMLLDQFNLNALYTQCYHVKCVRIHLMLLHQIQQCVNGQDGVTITVCGS